jgi:hypothetical protein
VDERLVQSEDWLRMNCAFVLLVEIHRATCNRKTKCEPPFSANSFALRSWRCLTYVSCNTNHLRVPFHVTEVELAKVLRRAEIPAHPWAYLRLPFRIRIKQLLVVAEHCWLNKPQGIPMIEYAILIVMVIFAGGFAWLWLIEQKKRKEARRQKEIERRWNQSGESRNSRVYVHYFIRLGYKNRRKFVAALEKNLGPVRVWSFVAFRRSLRSSVCFATPARVDVVLVCGAQKQIIGAQSRNWVPLLS